MRPTRTLALPLLLAGLFATQVQADDSDTTTPATGSTVVTTPASAIDMTNNCAKGGTRSVKGTYDLTAGTLDLTTTLTACVLRNSQTHDGTTSTKGTLLATRSGFDIDLATKINTTITYKDGTTLTRTCDITKKGSFIHATQMFDGTETRNNCTLAGKVREHENIIEHLLRDLTKSEMDGGDDSNNRTLPVQPGERD